MASLVTITIALAVVLVLLFGAFIVISMAIRREDATGTITGRAPSRVSRSARFLVGWHRSRWV